MLSEAAKKRADEALQKGMWLYDPSYKKWYSPEDFKHIFTYADASEDWVKQLKILDPRIGIQAGFQRLAEVQNKLQALANMVIKYYTGKRN